MTDNEYNMSVNEHELGWRSPQGEDTEYLARSGQWSSNNPYRQALLTTTNKRNRQSLLNAALRWEEEYANTNRANAREDELLDRQRQNELEDRAHEEEYSSPEAQAARMREAGLNPDLQNISGGSSLDPQNDLGTSPVQAGAEFESPQPLTGTEIAGTIFDGIGTLVSAATGIYGIYSGVKELPGALRSQTLSNELKTTDIVDKNIATMGVLADIAGSSLDEDGNRIPVTGDSIRKLGNAFGFSPYSGYAGKQHPGDKDAYDYFANNSGLRERAAQSAVRARNAEMFDKTYTLDNVKEQTKYQIGVQLARSASEYWKASYEKEFNKALSSGGYGNLAAATTLATEALSSAEASELVAGDFGRNSAQLKINCLKDSLRSYDAFIKHRGELTANMNSQIKDLETQFYSEKDSGKRRRLRMRIFALRSSLAQIDTLTYQDAYQYQDSFMRAACQMARDFVAESGDYTMETSEDMRLWYVLNGNMSDINTFSQAFGNAVVDVLGGVASAVAGGKAGATKNITSHSTVSSTVSSSSQSTADVTIRHDKPKPSVP